MESIIPVTRHFWKGWWKDKGQRRDWLLTVMEAKVQQISSLLRHTNLSLLSNKTFIYQNSPPLFALPQLLSVTCTVVNLLTAVNTMTLPEHTRQSLPPFCPTFCLCSLWSLISVQKGRMKRHRYCSIPAGKCCAALQLPHLQRREGTLPAFPAASSNFSAAKHGAHFQKGMTEARLLCEGKAGEWGRCACREWMGKVKSHKQLHKMQRLTASLTADTVSNAGQTTALLILCSHKLDYNQSLKEGEIW